jgi:cytochrome c551/c552
MPGRGALYAAAAVVAAAMSVLTAVARPDDGGGDAEALDGAAVFAVKGCAACHDGPQSTSFVDVGPSLADAPSWAGERIEGLSAEQYIEQSMRSPAAFISPAYRSIGGPNEGMPVLQLSDAEITAVVEYLLGR